MEPLHRLENVTPLEILKEVEGLIRLVDELIYHINSHSPTHFSWNLLRSIFRPSRVGILRLMMQQEAFTVKTLGENINSTRNLINILQGVGIVRVAKKIEGDEGNRPLIYLLVGGDARKVEEAEKLHKDLTSKSHTYPLSYFERRSIPAQAIELLETQMGESKVVHRPLIYEALRKLKVSSEAAEEVQRVLKEKGWRIIY